jgi:hypothetical protein
MNFRYAIAVFLAITHLARGDDAAGEDADPLPRPSVFLSQAGADGDEDDGPVSVEELMHSVVATLPREPLHIKGSFWVRRRRGIAVTERDFEMHVHWGAEPSTARYVILGERSGKPIEEMRLVRQRGRPALWRYRKGDPLAEHPLPDLYASMHGTDLSWMDLSLSFLWWPGGKITGSERVRGYRCHVVEIPAPARPATAEPPSKQDYAKVRLWIENKHRMLLQAEGFDAAGRRLRRLWVRSVRKIDERWMIKDMEVQSYPAIHRTKLTIHEAKASDPS